MTKIDLSIYNNDSLPFVTSADPIVMDDHNEIVYNKEGIYSQQIFGPVQDYVCECGEVFNKMNEGIICDICGVECTSSDKRSTQWANIKLNFYIINPSFEYIIESIFGSKPIKSLLSVNQNIIERIQEEPYYWDNIKGSLVDYIPSNTIIFKDKPLAIDNVLKLYGLFNLLRKNNHGKLDKYLRELLDVLFIKYIPVQPPSIRPINVIGSMVRIHQTSRYYNDILFRLTMNKIDAKSTELLLKEYHHIYKTFKTLINENTEKNFSGNTSFLRRYLYGKNVDRSSYNVLVPDPTLNMNQISLNEHATMKILEPQYKQFVYEEISHKSQLNINEAYRIALKDQLTEEQENLLKKKFLNKVNNQEIETNILLERAPVLRPYNIVGVDIKGTIDAD